MRELDKSKENSEILRLFGDYRKFAALSDDDLHTLIASGKFRVYEAGEVLIREGEYDSMVYFLISGKLEIVKAGKPIGKLQRNGDMFGEMGIIDGSPRSASVRAVVKSLVLGLDASYFDRKQQASSLTFSYILYRLFAEVLAARLRDTTQENIRLREAISRMGHIDY